MQYKDFVNLTKIVHDLQILWGVNFCETLDAISSVDMDYLEEIGLSKVIPTSNFLIMKFIEAKTKLNASDEELMDIIEAVDFIEDNVTLLNKEMRK